jgi:MarR family transcriptional regulator, organic hydroperoxide resistance regulator
MSVRQREKLSAALPRKRSLAVRDRKSAVKPQRAAHKRRADKAVTPIERLSPDDYTLREFVADLYAALSVMRILRQHIAHTAELTSAEFSVMLAVWHLERHGSLTVRAIAEHLHVAAAYVTAEIGKLVDAGLLLKGSHPTDKRAVEVKLTKAGRTLFDRVMPMLREVNDQLFVGTVYGDMVTVHRFLARIIEQGGQAIRVTEAYMPGAGGRGK